MENKGNNSKPKKASDYFEAEWQREEERKKHFKFVKRYKDFDLYEHKKCGYKECFKRRKK